MKKIIATVLAMVMALALCTTAFAAQTYTKATVTDPTKTTKGLPTYYVGDTDGLYYLKSGNSYTVMTDAQADVVTAGGFYLSSALDLYSKADAATCSDDGYDVNVYTANSKFYLSSKDLSAAGYTDAEIAAMGVTVYFGTKLADAAEYREFGTAALAQAAILTKGTHALYKTDKVFGVNEAVVYTCAICGGEYVLQNGVDTSKDDVANLKKLNGYVAADAAKTLAKKGVALSKAAPDGNYYIVKAGTAASGSTTGAKPSPKTFDAGIALYAAMALTSVAGSAVVIGKKKEF